MRLNADVFIFTDYNPQDGEGCKRFWDKVVADFRKNSQPLSLIKSTMRTRVFKAGGKWGFLFFQDNNDVLAKITESRWKIDVFVGIRDGCTEGGNYECVHKNPFLEKLLAAASSPLVYFTNHSKVLVDDEETQRRSHVYFKHLVLHESLWEFVLRCVLIIPSWKDHSRRDCGFFAGSGCSIRPEDLEIVYPSISHQAPSFSIPKRAASISDCELLKLSQFRIRHNEDVIAQYDVMKLDPKQNAPKDADKPRR